MYRQNDWETINNLWTDVVMSVEANGRKEKRVDK